MTDIDTIIIGGGISGLYTAMQLRKQNIPFLLLEAKSILGGRISSKSIGENSDLSIDLGPTWFWPHQQRMIQLISELGVEYFDQYTQGDALYQLRSSNVPSRTQGVGALSSYRIKGGMEKLISALAETLPTETVKNNHQVSDIEHINNHWHITAINNDSIQKYQAKRLVLAIPPRLIVNYLTPEKYLSKSIIQSLARQQTWMSGQAKFVAVYEKPFWREQGLAGQVYSQVGPMVEIHDASASSDQGYALFGFLGLPSFTRKQMTIEQLKVKCLEQLVSIFGEQARKTDVCYLTDWATDKWVATEKDSVEPPRHAEFPIKQHEQELQRLDLHLVATEVSQTEAGYLEGALAAADRALLQIIK